jgi:hypothetical protein
LAIKICVLIECLLLLMTRFIKRPWERNINELIKAESELEGRYKCLMREVYEIFFYFDFTSCTRMDLIECKQCALIYSGRLKSTDVRSGPDCIETLFNE